MIKSYTNFFLTFSILLFATSCNCGENVKIIKKPVNKPSDIVAITDSLVIPYVYTSAVSLKSLPVKEKKQKFFDMMLPAIMVDKQEIDINHRKLVRILNSKKLSHQDSIFVNDLMVKYKTTNTQLLKSRLTTFPVSIVLAQAAIESAWGTSRFFVEADNPFGLWSFNSNEQRIEASSTRNGTKVFLRKFDNLKEAIDAYFTTLATGPFKDFRKTKLETQDPYILVKHLIDYSERGEAYVKEVTDVIRVNNLTKYDSYRIAPEYLNQCD